MELQLHEGSAIGCSRDIPPALGQLSPSEDPPAQILGKGPLTSNKEVHDMRGDSGPQKHQRGSLGAMPRSRGHRILKVRPL